MSFSHSEEQVNVDVLALTNALIVDDAQVDLTKTLRSRQRDRC
jgi:hypothetical protein